MEPRASPSENCARKDFGSAGIPDLIIPTTVRFGESETDLGESGGSQRSRSQFAQRSVRAKSILNPQRGPRRICRQKIGEMIGMIINRPRRVPVVFNRSGPLDRQYRPRRRSGSRPQPRFPKIGCGSEGRGSARLQDVRRRHASQSGSTKAVLGSGMRLDGSASFQVFIGNGCRRATLDRLLSNRSHVRP